MKKSLVIAPLFAAGAMLSTAALAHHSVQNVFDVNKTIAKQGILKDIDWQNPHAWFHFAEIDKDGKPVMDKDGKQVIWSLETTGPNGLRQLGLADRRLFPIGEKFSFSGYPARNGETKAFTLQVKFPDGRTMTLGFIDGASVPAL
jgi:hypothetical protein